MGQVAHWKLAVAVAQAEQMDRIKLPEAAQAAHTAAAQAERDLAFLAQLVQAVQSASSGPDALGLSQALMWVARNETVYPCKRRRSR